MSVILTRTIYTTPSLLGDPPVFRGYIDRTRLEFARRLAEGRLVPLDRRRWSITSIEDRRDPRFRMIRIRCVQVAVGTDAAGRTAVHSAP